MKRWQRIGLIITVILTWAVVGYRSVSVYAESVKAEVDALADEVKGRQERIKHLDEQINKYRDRVREQERQVVSLKNQVLLLENRIEEKRLAVERTRDVIQLTGIQIDQLRTMIRRDEAAIARRQAAMAELLRHMAALDRVSTLELVFSRPSLSELFARMEEVKTLQGELAEVTVHLKKQKQELLSRRQEMEQRRLSLEDQSMVLAREQDELIEQRLAKVSLAQVTQNREEEFQRVLYELRQQQQEEADVASQLQERLKDKLNALDRALARGDILLNWPVPIRRGISAHFHDKTYPFRQFFEHPGVDVPTPVGTPIRAAAGGYVAWTRTGRQYGNYIMVVHPGGIATVYAHLSRFASAADTYVDRGDIIGYSGGRPGDPGAGLSTGPHVHFEVRQNGIPVDPENFLPDLD